MTAASIIAADIGRTTCRLAVDDRPPVHVANGASLADRDGVAAVLAALDAACERAEVAGEAADAVTAVCLGVTGAAQAPDARGELAAAVQRRYPAATVTVTSDVVSAHVGALAGEPGVVTVAGTGAVALAVGPDGRSHLVDGHGPLLGDAGSGTWIGRQALAAALRHHDGRPGGSAALAAAAEARFGPIEGLVGRIQGGAHPWRDVAAFVPDAATAADGGDSVARTLFAAAAQELAATTRAAARALCSGPDGPVPTTGTRVVPAVLVGGLADLVHLVGEPFTGALTSPGATPDGAAPDPPIDLVPPAGDALAGARRLAVSGPGVHHELVLQLPSAGASRPRGAVATATRNTRPEEE